MRGRVNEGFLGHGKQILRSRSSAVHGVDGDDDGGRRGASNGGRRGLEAMECVVRQLPR